MRPPYLLLLLVIGLAGLAWVGQPSIGRETSTVTPELTDEYIPSVGDTYNYSYYMKRWVNHTASYQFFNDSIQNGNDSYLEQYVWDYSILHEWEGDVVFEVKAVYNDMITVDARWFPDQPDKNTSTESWSLRSYELSLIPPHTIGAEIDRNETHNSWIDDGSAFVPSNLTTKHAIPDGFVPYPTLAMFGPIPHETGSTDFAQNHIIDLSLTEIFPLNYTFVAKDWHFQWLGSTISYEYGGEEYDVSIANVYKNGFTADTEPVDISVYFDPILDYHNIENYTIYSPYESWNPFTPENNGLFKADWMFDQHSKSLTREELDFTFNFVNIPFFCSNSYYPDFYYEYYGANNISVGLIELFETTGHSGLKVTDTSATASSSSTTSSSSSTSTSDSSNISSSQDLNNGSGGSELLVPIVGTLAVGAGVAGGVVLIRRKGLI